MTNFTKTKFGKQARRLFMDGAKEVYRAVSTTLGPRGRNVVINKGYQISVIHDGVKVARQIEPKNMFKNSGANILKEAAEKHVNTVGDGTTLTTILGYQLMKEASVLVESGVNPMALRSALEKGRDIVIDEINNLSLPIKTEKQKIDIATISSADKELGQMIGSTLHKIGLDGVLTAEETKSYETTLEHEEGTRIDKGYFSPYFATDPRDMSATIQEARILLTDRELSDIYDILPFIEEQLKPNNTRNLVIVAPEVKGTALASFIQTKMRGGMNILCVKAPSFGVLQKQMLEDLAIMTGGTFMAEEKGKNFKEYTFDDLGYAKTVKATEYATTFIGLGGDDKKIKDRVGVIKQQMEDPDTEFDKEKLKERLSKMTGGVYVIKVGGATEIEMGDRKERVDDAILATQAAIQSGIVPGGEVTFLTVIKKLKPTNQNEEYAYRIITNALQKPFEKLLTNAGLNPGYYMAKLEDKEFGYGVDVVMCEIKDMIKAGIVDPTSVLTEALRSAMSVAIMVITGDAGIIIDEVNTVEKKR